MRAVKETVLSDAARDFKEDLATRWTPDVLADLDFSEAMRYPAIGRQDVRFADVPKPSGGIRRVPILSGSAISAMRSAVEPIRRVSDSLLDPSVCGYRTGASGDVSYSEEYRRFRSFSEALSDQSAWVVIADIEDFFGSVSVDAMRKGLSADLPDSVEPLAELMGALTARGLRGLPAGYGDARLIGNVFLSSVDTALSSPFTRWVDDYRIFTSTRDEAEDSVRELDIGLANLGLSLNRSKLAIMSSIEYRNLRHGVPLDSVYHPQDESSATVRANLRSVFLSAVSEGDRRRLRFVLPRLAEQGDPTAVRYALSALQSGSIDAPRLVQYLAAFLDNPTVEAQVTSIATNASSSDWTMMRVAPLLFQIELGDSSVLTIVDRLQKTSSPLLWGLLVRLLGSQQRRREFNHIYRNTAHLDYRAVLGAGADLGVEIDQPWLREVPFTVASIHSRGSAPLPSNDSLL